MATSRPPFPKDFAMPQALGAAGQPPAAPQPDQQGGDTPESTHYHEDEQRCELCSHMDADGQCAVLNMTVSPTGGCDKFDGTGTDDASSDDDQDFGTDDDDTDTSRGVYDS
jgi:hypothetical protein